jgi:hypothetical protein
MTAFIAQLVVILLPQLGALALMILASKTPANPFDYVPKVRHLAERDDADQEEEVNDGARANRRRAGRLGLLAHWNTSALLLGPLHAPQPFVDDPQQEAGSMSHDPRFHSPPARARSWLLTSTMP